MIVQWNVSVQYFMPLLSGLKLETVFLVANILHTEIEIQHIYNMMLTPPKPDVRTNIYCYPLTSHCKRHDFTSKTVQ